MTNVKKTVSTENAKHNIKIVNNAIKAFKKLRSEFKSAENNYQAAKYRIYNVLSVVFEHYVEFKSEFDISDNKNKKALGDLFEKKIKELGDEYSISATKATSLELRMLRLVTGEAFKQEREKVYARCLRIAFNEKVHLEEDMSFADWIVACGGIEELRRNSEGKKSESEAAARIEYNAINASVQLPKSLANKFQSLSNGDADFAVALVRKSEGAMMIVATVDSKSAVTATLKALGKGKSVEDAQNAADEARAKREAIADSITQKFLNGGAGEGQAALEAATANINDEVKQEAVANG